MHCSSVKFSLSMHTGKESCLKKSTILVAVLLLRELQSLMHGLIYSFRLKGCFYLQNKKNLFRCLLLYEENKLMSISSDFLPGDL